MLETTKQVERDRFYLYCKHRLFERHNIDITPLEYIVILDGVRNENNYFPLLHTEKISNRISAWLVFINNRWLPFFYDKHIQRIRTFLPTDYVKRNINIINTYLLQKESQSILYCDSCRLHAFQDNIYGFKMRIHSVNRLHTKAVCSVCDNITQLTPIEIKVNKQHGGQNHESKSI